MLDKHKQSVTQMLRAHVHSLSYSIECIQSHQHLSFVEAFLNKRTNNLKKKLATFSRWTRAEKKLFIARENQQFEWCGIIPYLFTFECTTKEVKAYHHNFSWENITKGKFSVSTKEHFPNELLMIIYGKSSVCALWMLRVFQWPSVMLHVMIILTLRNDHAVNVI